MISSRAVRKGAFRLSVVAAVLGGAYTAFELWQSNVQSNNNARKMVSTYEYGAGRSDEDLKAASNGYTIDLSKLACSSQPFYASFAEIQETREGTLQLIQSSNLQVGCRGRYGGVLGNRLVRLGQLVSFSFPGFASRCPLGR